MGFKELFLVNLKVVYRNTSGIFWTLAVPALIYTILALLPLPNFGDTNFDYSDYLLSGIIAMVIMQGGVYTLAYWMVDMRARGVIRRFQVTPLKKRDLILALLCARGTVSLAQTILLTFIGVVFFDASFQSNPAWVVLFVCFGAFIFLPLGLLISTFADTYESAAPITAAIALPFVFLGNIFYPVDSLPEALQMIANVLPTTYLADGFRAIYLTGDIGRLPLDIGVLAAWMVGVIILTIWRFKFRE
jgi:ABC-2 type transport system permease protein